MRKTMITALSLAFAAIVAHPALAAASLPAKAATETPFNWSGVYFGDQP